jgi:hypothetical protein
LGGAGFSRTGAVPGDRRRGFVRRDAPDSKSAAPDEEIRRQNSGAGGLVTKDVAMVRIMWHFTGSADPACPMIGRRQELDLLYRLGDGLPGRALAYHCMPRNLRDSSFSVISCFAVQRADTPIVPAEGTNSAQAADRRIAWRDGRSGSLNPIVHHDPEPTQWKMSFRHCETVTARRHAKASRLSVAPSPTTATTLKTAA